GDGAADSVREAIRAHDAVRRLVNEIAMFENGAVGLERMFDRLEDGVAEQIRVDEERVFPLARRLGVRALQRLRTRLEVKSPKAPPAPPPAPSEPVAAEVDEAPIPLLFPPRARAG